MISYLLFFNKPAMYLVTERHDVSSHVSLSMWERLDVLHYLVSIMTMCFKQAPSTCRTRALGDDLVVAMDGKDNRILQYLDEPNNADVRFDTPCFKHHSKVRWLRQHVRRKCWVIHSVEDYGRARPRSGIQRWKRFHMQPMFCRGLQKVAQPS